ncbi:hypothetical protein CCP3SC1AL1_1650004 [Gammaproteobacteria bacterium]
MSNNIMFLSFYAIVIVGAMPVIATASTAGVIATVVFVIVGAIPTKLTEPTTVLTVPAKTIFKYPASL